MKKFIKILFICFLTFMLASCSIVDMDKVNVEQPNSEKFIIRGKWAVTKCIFSGDSFVDNFQFKELIGKEVGFTNTQVVILNQYIDGPVYRSRNLDTRSFLFRQYNIEKEKLGINEDRIDVVDIYKNDEIFYEILRITDKEALLYFRGFFLQINKIDDKISDEEMKDLIKKTKDFDDMDLDLKTSDDNALLLGIRRPSNTSIEGYEYSSYFINLSKDKNIEVRELKDLIVPKRSEFFKVKVERRFNEDIYDEIRIEPLKGNPVFSSYVNDQKYFKRIDYISPDYISLEMTNVRSNFKILRLKMIENISSPLSLKLRDFIENGDNVYKDSATGIIQKSPSNQIDTSNLGIYRREGYWKLRGRINDFNSSLYEDFDIMTILPKDMAKLDSLALPFNTIKKELNYVKDAFTSPNHRYLICIQEGNLKIYEINYGKIDSEVLVEKFIGLDSDVIMAEWAVGSYAGLWDIRLKED